MAEYDRSLKRPNRFRTLYGTAKAADAAGDRARAEHYFRELNRVADKADTPLPELAEKRPIWRDNGTTCGWRWQG